LDKRKPELSDQENLDAFNSFTPGYPYRPDVDMEEFIPDSCPNKAKVGEPKNEYCTKPDKFHCRSESFCSGKTGTMTVAVGDRTSRTIHVFMFRLRHSGSAQNSKGYGGR